MKPIPEYPDYWISEHGDVIFKPLNKKIKLCINTESLFDLETLDITFIDSALHGKTNQIKTDILGQHIRIGDIVSYGKMGGYKGLSVGVVLGYTAEGYRVSRFYKDPGVEYFYCSEIQTPGIVTVIKSNRK